MENFNYPAAIGGIIGAASGFLNFAAGSVSFTGIGATIEKAANHAFVDMWMGGVKNAVYGGELSPLRDAIGGALSSVGNGLINDKFDNTALKVAASAVFGGTVSEIGGGKFANGAVTGAYSMLFNELMHNYQVKKWRKKLAALHDGINSVRSKATIGRVITRKDLVEKYGVPKNKVISLSRELNIL